MSWVSRVALIGNDMPVVIFYIFKIMFDRTLIDTITQYWICLKCTRRCIFLPQKKKVQKMTCTLL